MSSTFYKAQSFPNVIDLRNPQYIQFIEMILILFPTYLPSRAVGFSYTAPPWGCPGSSVLLSDTSGEELLTVRDLHPASPAEAHCPAAILSAEFLHSFITPVPTDKAVMSPPDKAASHGI